MEGNFYISEIAVRRELKSNFGKSCLQCPKEMEHYAKCIEAAHINKNLAKGVCGKERKALMECTNGHWKALKESNRKKI